MPATSPPRKRFFAKVAIEGDCWIWTGARNNGYGVFNVGAAAGGRVRGAHRVLWEWRYGPVPEGLVLDHLCRNRACVKPSHLEVTTHRENILRGEGATAAHAKATHCPHGHEYTPENTRLDKRGYRWCETCRRARRVAEGSTEKNRARAREWYWRNRDYALAQARERRIRNS